MVACRRVGRVYCFQREIRHALGYERGLVIKLVAVLIVVAVVILVRTLYFA
jgi:uncharacterized membrane protein